MDVRAITMEARYAARGQAVASAEDVLDDDDPKLIVTALEDLTVFHCRELAPEDREWFNSHIPTMHWVGR